MAISVLALGCGSARTGENAVEEDPTSTIGSTVDPDQAMADFQRCMSEQGAVIGSIDSSEPGGVVVDNSTQTSSQPDLASLDAATEACRGLLDDAYDEFEADAEMEAELADENLEMQRCLRDLGYDVVASDGGSFTIELTADQDPNEYQQALVDCSS